MQANRKPVDPTSINLPELSPEEIRRGLSKAKRNPFTASIPTVLFLTFATLGVMLISYFVGFKSGSESGAQKAIELQKDNSIRLPIFQPIAPKNDEPISPTSELIAPQIFKEAPTVPAVQVPVPITQNPPVEFKNSETKVEDKTSDKLGDKKNDKNHEKQILPFYRFSLGRGSSGEAAIGKLEKKGFSAKLVKKRYGGFDILVGPFESEAQKKSAIAQIRGLAIR